jgi:DNA damage-binding protein 1
MSLIPQVVLYSMQKEPGLQGYKLTKVQEWNHNNFITQLVTSPSGDELFVGDAIHSISVIRLDGTKFTTVARDYAPLWPVSLNALDYKTLVGADVSCFPHYIHATY